MKKSNLKTKENQKAITLVALIITVIILLILAIVSISLIINKGIISRAKYGTEIYSLEQLKEQLYLKNNFDSDEGINGKLSDLDLNINENFINDYNDILYVKDGKLYLSFIAGFPNTEKYRNNMDKIESLKDTLEICYDELKAFNIFINPYFDIGLNGYNSRNTPGNITKIENENNNNYLYIELHTSSGNTQYVYQSRNAASNYGEKVYVNLKYRNRNIDSVDNYKINTPIILSRSGNGYDQTMLTAENFVNNYNKGWINVSTIRTVEEKTGTKGLQITLGGGRGNLTTWEYSIDFDDVYGINLTEIFGVGNEPTKAQMDEIFNNL